MDRGTEQEVDHAGRRHPTILAKEAKGEEAEREEQMKPAWHP